MFGSTSPFGQSSTSPFGSQQQSVFGQNNNTASNPFAPKPFGSTNPFGSQTGGSIFGGNSTGVFGGTQASSPLPSTPTFGNTASAPSFGGSVPSFGSPTPAFGSGSSLFGQKPAFGGFGSTPPSQSSPFGGSTFQQTQSAFGGNAFSSSAPFGAQSQPAFGTNSSPAFGATNTPAFGAPTTPAFGAATTPAFGSQPTAAFGAATTPAFGSQPTSTFGSGGGFGTPAFGSTSTPAFGSTSTPAFGSTSTPAFGSTSAASTTPFGAQPFSFGTTPAFGQTNSGFGSTPFGSTPSVFGAQSSSFGTQSTTPSTFGSPGSFGQPGFSGGQQQRGGSRVVAYAPTVEADQSGVQSSGKLESISAMPVYKEKSHEELRWEDYQLGDKGGPNPAGQQSSIGGFGTTTTPQPNPFGSTPTNPFTSTTAANPFGQKTSSFPSTPSFGTSGFNTSTPSNPFATGSSPSTTSVFGQPSTPSFFGTTPNSTPSNTTSLFNQTPGTTNTFGTGLSIGTTPAFPQTNNLFGTSSSTFAPSTTSSFSQPTNAFTPPNSGFGNNMFNSTPSQPSSSTSLFGQTNPSQQSQPAFSFPSFGQQQQQPAGGGFGASTGFGATSSIFNSASNVFGQNAFGQQPIGSQSNTVAPQPAAVATNPFGTLPTMPQISIGHTGSAPSIQYGISNMPVVDKPAPVRVSSLLTSRHLSQRRIRLPARRSHPKNDGARVPFFSDDEEAPSTPKADALFIPRENPRALVIRPLEHWTSRTSAEKSKDTNNIPLHENGKLSEKDSGSSLNGSINQEKHKINPSLGENGHDKERTQPAKSSQKANGVVHEEHSKNTQNGDSYITLNGHRAGEAAIVYEHGADIEALMPKLRHSDYYTEPRIQELAAKERAEPGFCRRVKDFVVGRHGFGSIKFAGETDVRNLDLESLVQFNNREVIVYLDESKKPPVGQGLNKAAVVTLLNIKCFDKKTGQQYTEGVKVEKYKEMLMKKARDQGAEFVSYDPIKGEWKFRVNHFSRYMLDDADEEVGVEVALLAC
ncbi:hypothetical protein MKW98_003482 [Papaver atlanticum]|uniref:Nucleoporin autopeptidase n=1 Tax=Papaver atlanticum TaxID=357466 RepID=A0AAD4XTS3_9MAGN|nr:hypothetical protein MKW98_003482 [Papaver atlanticum]